MTSAVYIVVTPFFPTSISWRGAFGYDFVAALKNAVERLKKDCRIVVFKEGDGNDYEIGGVAVHTFPVRRLPSNIFPLLFTKRNQESFLRKVREVGAREGWSVGDVIVCHGHTANYGVYPLALKTVNPKSVTLLHHHDLQSFGLNNGALSHCWLYNLIQFPIMRHMHEQIDCHVFISEASRRSFLMAPSTKWTKYADYKKQMRGLPWRPVRIKDSIILHNGVNKAIFNNVAEDSNALKIGCLMTDAEASRRRAFVIGCVGNFQPLKDQITLIRAVGLIDHAVKVIFVGSGTTFEKCKALAREQEERSSSTSAPKTYSFLPEMRHEQLPSFFRSLDLFVLPSFFEGFGCVYTEAYACGTPFIACRGQGINDIIYNEDFDKWLCNPESPEELAQKITTYIESRSSQRLNEDQDINSLVVSFLTKILPDK